MNRISKKLGLTEVPKWHKCKDYVLSTKNKKHRIIKDTQDININQEQALNRAGS